MSQVQGSPGEPVLRCSTKPEFGIPAKVKDFKDFKEIKDFKEVNHLTSLKSLISEVKDFKEVTIKCYQAARFEHTP